MWFWDAVASDGPYANNFHLAPDRQPHQHLTSQFLEVECSSWCSICSVKALKEIVYDLINAKREVMLNFTLKT